MKYSRIVSDYGYKWMNQITIKELALMLYMIEQCTTDLNPSVAIVKKEHKKQFAEEMDVTIDYVNKMLEKLLRIGFIIEERKDVYMVNPMLVNHGHLSEFNKNYQAYCDGLFTKLSPLNLKPIQRYGLIDLLTGELSARR